MIRIRHHRAAIRPGRILRNQASVRRDFYRTMQP
jgi:hypothetical protein